MEISMSSEGEVSVIHLNGRLDMFSSHHLDDYLKPFLVEGKKLVFDCSNLAFICSAGLRVMISALHYLPEHHGAVAFSSMTPPVLELFKLCGIEPRCIIEPTIAAAVKRLDPD